MFKHRKFVLIVIGFLFVSIIGATASLGIARARQEKFIPPAAINFGIWYPVSGKTEYVLEQNTLQYDKPTGIITFKLNNKNDNVLTFSQQVVPENFSISPEAFDQQLAVLQQVTKFDSVNGTVAITKGSENGQGTAVLRSKGTLLFAYTKNPLGVDEWRRIFNDLELVY